MEFNKYSNKAGGSVEAHEVTDETAGQTVRTRDGRSRETHTGDVLVKTYRPDEYDFAGPDFLDNHTRESSSDTTAKESSPEVSSPEAFDPSEHNANEVREYLSRDDVDEDEKRRVVAMEQAGKNRSSAFPA